jgi:methyl-accepting chemotaxis protein
METIASMLKNESDGIVKSLSDNAREMTIATQSMRNSAGQEGDRSKSALHSAEEILGIASRVAAATEQMTSSVSEIRQRFQSSSVRAQVAVQNAARKTQQIAILSETGERIGNVMEQINTIAAQTNFRVQNATIEAAHAGEAGKAFTVIANKVKAPAARATKATAEISN